MLRRRRRATWRPPSNLRLRSCLTCSCFSAASVRGRGGLRGRPGRELRRTPTFPKLLRRGLADAGLTTGFEHRCCAWHCGYRETFQDKGTQFCPNDGKRLSPVPRVRQLRFHDLRHTAVHLLFDAGLDAAVVQAMARHRDSKTTQRYAHLRADWALRKIANMSLLPRSDAPQLHPIATFSAPAVISEKEKRPKTS